MKEIKIFYSWQSDLENQTNRTLIETCIEKAVSSLNKESALFDFIVDSAIRDEAGAADIPNSILKKIREANIFVGDITIINKESSNRKTPNPNVLIELGYAAGVLDWPQIICVANLEHGAIEELPFDIRHRKIVSYQCHKSEEKTDTRKLLIGKLTYELKQFTKKLNPDDYNEFEVRRLNLELFKLIKSKLPFELVNKISKLDFSKNLANSISEARKMNDFIDTLENPEILYLGGKLFESYLSLVETAIFLAGNSKLNPIFSETDKIKAKQQLRQVQEEYCEKAKKLKDIYRDFVEAGNELLSK